MSRSKKFKSPLHYQRIQRSSRGNSSSSAASGLLIILIAITVNIIATEASQDLLPHLCDSVKCPALTDITCPEDSDERDTSLPVAAALLMVTSAAEASSPSSSSSSPSPATTAASSMTFFNASDVINESIYAQCCLSKKCICKTCYIPDCHNDYEVVIELIPESMDTPGHCCGQYNCQKEPNCTEVLNTENYWLTDCQRCKCYFGERICHQSCDEDMRKSTAICNSKTLNTFFENGESWKDGCYECECVNGEEKCVMPFCRSVNCPTYRQVILKDSCCPICWPKGIPMPNGDEDYEDENIADHVDIAGKHIYDDSDDDDDSPIATLQHHSTDNYASSGNEVDTLLPNINFEKDFVNTTTKAAAATRKTSTETAASTTTTTPIATVWEILAANSTPTTKATKTTVATESMPPCLVESANSKDSSSATYQIFPKMIHSKDQNYLHYTIIGVLGMIIVLLAVWNIHLRAKQRSYRPVSNFDDNFNKMSSNIKKMNDYV